jgi:UV DNA damage endonuclease
MHRAGYCCINLHLQSENIRTSRRMILRTFEERGVDYANELAYQNVKDLKTILEWNVEHCVGVFRIGAGIFPWHHKYDLTDLLNYNEIVSILKECGQIVIDNNMRVSTHPDHFVKLASLKDRVVEQSIVDLEIDNTLLDLMGLEASHKYPINIHVGQGGEIPEVADRFIRTFDRLSDNLKKRLVVENDDKESMFSVARLYDYIYPEIKTPITFDYFHHSLHPDGLTEEEAFHIAYGTWDETPLFHYSESKAVNENINCAKTAHADFITTHIINDYGLPLDVDLEAKAKELAVFAYRKLSTNHIKSLMKDVSEHICVA